MSEIPKLFFYTLGSLWFVINISQKSWQNRILYTIMEDQQTYYKIKLKNIEEKNKPLE